MTPYVINGQVAQGEDYVGAIDALPSDDLVYVRVGASGKGTLMVSTWPGGFLVTDERLDGSAWGSPVLARERVKDVVGLFLAERDDWRQGLEWELITLTTRDARYRTVRVVLIGVILIALVSWLACLFR